MKEKYDKTVTFEDITAEAMGAILDFLYSETIVLTEENVSEMLHAASIMQIEGNVTYCFCLAFSTWFVLKSSFL